MTRLTVLSLLCGCMSALVTNTNIQHFALLNDYVLFCLLNNHVLFCLSSGCDHVGWGVLFNCDNSVHDEFNDPVTASEVLLPRSRWISL